LKAPSRNARDRADKLFCFRFKRFFDGTSRRRQNDPKRNVAAFDAQIFDKPERYDVFAQIGIDNIF